jgi:hypothetical protein
LKGVKPRIHVRFFKKRWKNCEETAAFSPPPYLNKAIRAFFFSGDSALNFSSKSRSESLTAINASSSKKNCASEIPNAAQMLSSTSILGGEFLAYIEFNVDCVSIASLASLFTDQPRFFRKASIFAGTSNRPRLLLEKFTRIPFPA